MNGDDILRHNNSMPEFPAGMPPWQRVLCVLGYHRWERRESRTFTAGGETLARPVPIALRDQCSRCNALRD